MLILHEKSMLPILSFLSGLALQQLLVMLPEVVLVLEPERVPAWIQTLYFGCPGFCSPGCDGRTG